MAKKQELPTIYDERNQMVSKSNDIVQNVAMDLTTNEQKLIAYAISKIKPGDKELQWVECTVEQFCNLAALDRNNFYREMQKIGKTLKNDKCKWVRIDDHETWFSWFSEFKYYPGEGRVRILLNSDIQEHLLNLSNNFTEYELINVLMMKSKYAIRLFELFKSYAYQENIYFEIDHFRELIGATGKGYNNFNSLKKRIIIPSIEQINDGTCIKITDWKEHKKGSSQKVVGISFHIEMQSPYEMMIIKELQKAELNRKNGQLEGQMNLFDYMQ